MNKHVPAMIGRARLNGLLAGALIWLTAGYAIAFAHLQMFEPTVVASITPAYNDAMRYIAMTQHRGVAPSPYRYRVLVPAIASRIPDGVVRHLSSRPSPSADWLAAAKLSMINAGALALTAATIFLLGLAFHFDLASALLGSLLFLGMRPVIQSGGSPTIDASSWLVVAAGALAIVEERHVALLVIFGVGMFVKETALLLLPLAVLAPSRSKSRLSRLSLLAAFIPGLVAYGAFRLRYDPAAHGDVFGAWWDVNRVAWIDVSISRALSPSGLIDLASSFGLLWIPAVAAMRDSRTNPILRRWCVLLPAMLVLMLWLGTNLGRVMFLAFPMVLPCAVLGIERLLPERGGPVVST